MPEIDAAIRASAVMPIVNGETDYRAFHADHIRHQTDAENPVFVLQMADGTFHVVEDDAVEYAEVGGGVVVIRVP